MSDMHISDGEIDTEPSGERVPGGDRREAKDESMPFDARDAEEGELEEEPYSDQPKARSTPLLDAELFLSSLSKTLEKANSQDSVDAMEIDSELAASDISLRTRESEIWEGSFKNLPAKSRSRSSGASSVNPRNSAEAAEIPAVREVAAETKAITEEDVLRRLVVSEPHSGGCVLSIKKGLHSPGILELRFEIDAGDAERVARWSKRRESAELV